MQKWFIALACGCSIALVNAASAQVAIQVEAQPAQLQLADRALIMPGPFNGGSNRLLSQADAVFVGRVMAIEPMDIEAPQTANGPKVNYRIAVVQLSDSIFGLKKETKQVRVGFVVQANNAPGIGGGIQIQPAVQPGQPQIQIFQGRRPFPNNIQMQLAVGQDGLFSVNKHHKEDFFLAPTHQTFVASQNNPGFDGEVKTAKLLSKVMANPVASLKAEDKQDRYTAAAVLITKYRVVNNPTGQPMKLEPIDAEESKLILQALSQGDWTPGRFGAGVPNPFELFNQIGITQKDGYNPVNLRTQPEISQHMQKWLDENQGKYRIQKYVVDPNAKPGFDPKPGALNPIQPQPGLIRPLPIIKGRPGNVQPLPAPIEEIK